MDIDQASSNVTATLTTGAPREDFTVEEIADRRARTGILKLRFALRLSEHTIAVELALPASEPGVVTIHMPFARGPATSRLWLQSDADVIAPITALSLPTTEEGLAHDAAHAFVGLALRCGGQVADDGGYASGANLEAVKAMGATDMAFNKKRGLDIVDMAKSAWVYRQLKNFRAGIEAGISCLKGAYGLTRCTWKGLQHYRSFVRSSVVSHNLTVMARLRPV